MSQQQPPSPRQTVPPPVALCRTSPILPCMAVVLVLFIGFLFAGGLALLSRWLRETSLLFASQMTLLTVALCLTPTIARLFTKRRGRVAHVSAETLLFVTVSLGFGLWLFGTSIFGIWIAYTIVLVLLLEAGSNMIEWHRDTTLRRLSNIVLLKGDAEVIKKMFRNEVVLYISVPLGLAIGTVVGLIRHQTSQVTILFCFQLLLLLASFVLLYFLIYGFGRMCNPLFEAGPVSSPEIAVKERKGFLLKMIEIVVPPQPHTEDQEQKAIDLACDVSNLRKVYKYDALHNTILLVAFVATVVKLWGVTVDAKWLIVGLVAMVFVVSELPYAIGQNVLHQKLLERYTGERYEELAKKLKERAPVFPPLNFIVSLAATGTAGGFLYVLLNQFVQNTFQNIPK